MLQVALDKPAYKIGDTAKLRLDPRFAGIALITVIDDRLIAMKAVEVPADGTTVDLPVTDEWGPGAYVTASLYRPMDIAAKRMPARALGLTWAKVAPGDRDLDVSLDLPDEMRPRGPMTIPVVDRQPRSRASEAYVTVAAVDVGILNLTNFKPPAPDDWYFGQRKLGMEIRDLYGLLIDRMQGVPGTVRSGGDGGADAARGRRRRPRSWSPSIPASSRSGRTARRRSPSTFPTSTAPSASWRWPGRRTGVGHAAKDVIVRDPVVVTASLPRFLRVGRQVAAARRDQQRRRRRRRLSARDRGRRRHRHRAPTDQTRTVTLAEKRAPRVQHADHRHDARRLSIDGQPDLAGRRGLAEGRSPLGVRAAGLAGDAAQPRRRQPAAASSPSTSEPLAEFVPGTASVAVSLGGAEPLDVAGILAALDRYPYGCVEQLTSRAHAARLSRRRGGARSASAPTRRCSERVQKAIAGVLADQDAVRQLRPLGAVRHRRPLARLLRHRLPDPGRREGLRRAEAGARHRARQPRRTASPTPRTSTKGGEDIAYALYVLARTGRAAIGDLRYYAETKLGSFRDAARQGADRRGARPLWRPAAGGHGLRGGARRPRRQSRRLQHLAGRLRHARSATRRRC